MNRFSWSRIADGVCGRSILILLPVLFALLFHFPATADGGVPLVVVENAGQFGDGARYQVAGRGMTLWIADGALWITAMEAEKTDETAFGGLSDERSGSKLGERRAGRGETDAPRKGVALKLTFPGGNDSPKIEPFGRLETKISYFKGNDPEKWNPDVPVWSGVRYVDIYPGVDLEIVGKDGVLDPRFVVRDSGRAKAAEFFEKAALRIEGADGLDCDSETIRCSTRIGDVAVPLFGVEYHSGRKSAESLSENIASIPAPAVSGEAILHPFAARLPNDRTPTRGAGAADMIYGTFLGGSSGDASWGIAVDASGNAYVTGGTNSTTFPATPGTFQTTYKDSGDAFVAKLNANGTALLYGTYLGGSDYDVGWGIAVDASGNAYVTGYTGSGTFPITAGAFKTEFFFYDLFVTKLNANGTVNVISTEIGSVE